MRHPDGDRRTSSALRRMMTREQVTARSVGQLEPAPEGGVEPDTRIIASPDGPVSAGGGNDQPATRPMELPRLARPEGCLDHSLSPLCGKAGEPVSASTGRIGRPD